MLSSRMATSWKFVSSRNNSILRRQIMEQKSKGIRMVNHHPLRISQRSLTYIPGSDNQYGSLADPLAGSKLKASPAAWQAEDHTDVQRVTQKALIYELNQQQTKTIEDVVPWFLDNMPASYFRQIPEHFRISHLKAIAAVKDAAMDLYLNLKAQTHDGREVLTFIRPGTAPGTLLHMVEELPHFDDEPEMSLTRIHVFSTKDDQMSLNMFVYGKKNPGPVYNRFPVEELAKPILDFAQEIQAGHIPEIPPNPLFEKDALVEYLNQCTDNYIRIISKFPLRFFRQREMFEEISGTEGCEVHIEESVEAFEDPGGQYWVDIAVANSIPQVALENACRLLYLHDFDVTRARLDVVQDGENGSVTMLRLLVAPMTDLESKDMIQTFDLLRREIKRSKWLDPHTMELVFEKYPWLGVNRGEIITAFCTLMHPVLARENALAYSKGNILTLVTKPRYIQYAAQIADIFLERFHPDHPLSDNELRSKCDALKQEIASDVEDTAASGLLFNMMDIISHTLKTNVYMTDRYALGLRLDPAVMGEPLQKESPYGILFVHGRRFDGYHVRFSDIARGGMRLVTPASMEQYALESARQYDECYGLAFAQQLKNKDIPEGGSKAVCLINMNEIPPSSHNFIKRKSVKAFTDTVLDLIVETEETKKNIINLVGKKEVLYLGPDEQVIPEDINWIVKRAKYRGYDTPAAFMSSKPKAGINHKQYGVTSEGVNVYLDVALRRVLGIDPKKDSFTVKLTGGPDGDVGGNEIKILIREYGENVKIVGIADHSGCAEDPNGLNHEELMRLFHEGKCISFFDPSKLSSSGVVHLCDTDKGVKARNTMHNRLVADAFVPCGGRPNTIDGKNYRQFLKADGTPSSPLIVEGANLFVTAEARQKLFDEAGVVIVKDSSANKGGVITSSYEICAAMLLSEDEFFEHKEKIVDEVLAKLRRLAKLEAELLFRESEMYGIALPTISQIVSNSINTATDALAEALDKLSDEERHELLPLFKAHLPQTIADLSFHAVYERVPEQYIKNAISSCLASKMVYKEGTKFIEAQPRKNLAQMALKYLAKEKEVAKLMTALEKADVPEEEKKQLLKLLDAGGARAALGVNN